MEAATAIVHQPAAVLARPLEFTPEQTKMIRDTYANGASDSEFRVLIEIAKVRNLNPLLRQIWFIKRWDSQKRCEVWAVQTSIDGLRTIAQRTGLYDGQDEPTFGVEDASAFGLSKAEPFSVVSVYRKDWSRPATVKAYLAEYIGKTKDGKPTAMWAGKPHIMLSKCAEALALRKAFPEDTAGLYVPEEMDQAAQREEPAKPEPRKVRAAEQSKPAQQPAKSPPPTAPASDVIEGEVVATSKTESGRTIHIVDTPPEPPPPADADAPPSSEPVVPSLRDELLGELAGLGMDSKALGEWIERCRTALARKGISEADMTVLKADYKKHLAAGKAGQR